VLVSEFAELFADILICIIRNRTSIDYVHIGLVIKSAFSNPSPSINLESVEVSEKFSLHPNV
jgi:hypothetical protein